LDENRKNEPACSVKLNICLSKKVSVSKKKEKEGGNYK